MTDFFKELKSLITEGKFAEAKDALALSKSSHLSPSSLLELARLARQNGGAELTLRLLGPTVRPKNGKPLEASDAEKAEYAGALIKLGASEEASEILETLDPLRLPEISLFKAHIEIGHWNYREAIPHLNKFLFSPGLDEKQKVIGKLNLAAALIYERSLKDADSLLSELRKTTEKENWIIFRGNALVMSAQCAFFQGQFKEASDFLDTAEKVFGSSDSLYAYLTQKWKVILNLTQNGANEETLRQIEKLREGAFRVKHWESIRDCDFRRAIHTQDKDLFLYLYFGTPYKTFHKRLFLEFKSPVNIPDYFYRSHSLVSHKQETKIDIFGVKKEPFARPKSLNYRLASLLASDFYRPFSVGVLHARLYPDEFFNPDSSPARIYQAILTLRKLLSEKEIPIEIKESKDGYQLQVNPGHALCIPKSIAENEEEIHLNELRTKIKTETFTSTEVMKKLNLSRRGVSQLLKKAIESGEIKGEGFGGGAFYYFVKKKNAA